MQNETSIPALEEQSAPILQSGNRHYRLDVQGKRITFLDKRFYFTKEGEAVPSITTILDAYPKGAAFFEWLKRAGEDADEIRDEAGLRGSKVHALTEAYDRGEKISLLNDSGEISMSMLEWSMFERYVQFRVSNPDMVPILIEQNFISSKRKRAGTLDRVFKFRGRRLLLDIKTSSMVHEHYWLQQAGYKEIANDEFIDNGDHEFLKEHFIDEVSILWLNAKTRTEKPMSEKGAVGPCQGVGWQLLVRDTADQIRDLDRLNATHKLWMAENETAKPKEAIYQIEYQAGQEQPKLADAPDGLANVLKNGKGPVKGGK